MNIIIAILFFCDVPALDFAAALAFPFAFALGLSSASSAPEIESGVLLDAGLSPNL